MIEVILKMVQTILGWVFKIISLCKSVKVRCHRALLLPNGPECYFINVRNASPQREVEITHVWVANDNEIHILNPARPLPRLLKPEESWETWIPVTHLPEKIRENAYSLARVRLSDDKVFHSVRNRNIPAAGFVPGS